MNHFVFCSISTTLKQLFSRSIFGDNSVQVLSSMHSNVQLLYLLLFVTVFVGVAVLVAWGPYCLAVATASIWRSFMAVIKISSAHQNSDIIVAFVVVQ